MLQMTFGDAEELTCLSGTAVSMQTAVLGRLIAGIGASGMTDLISVLIVGKVITLDTTSTTNRSL